MHRTTTNPDDAAAAPSPTYDAAGTRRAAGRQPEAPSLLVNSTRITLTRRSSGRQKQPTEQSESINAATKASDAVAMVAPPRPAPTTRTVSFADSSIETTPALTGFRTFPAPASRGRDSMLPELPIQRPVADPDELVVRWPVRPSTLSSFEPCQDSQPCESCQRLLWDVWMHGCCRQHKPAGGEATRTLLANVGLLSALRIHDEPSPLPSSDFLLPQRIQNLTSPAPPLPDSVSAHIFSTARASQEADLGALRSALWDSERALAHWKDQVSKVERALKEAKRRSAIAESWLSARLAPLERKWAACGVSVASLAAFALGDYQNRQKLDMQRAEAYSLASSLVNTIRRQLSRIETERMEFSRLASIKAALVARKSELDEDSEGQDALRGTVVRLQDQSRSLRDRTVKLERELDLLCGKSDELARLLHAETALGEKLARETIRTAARKSDLEQAVAALHSDLATLDTSIATATTKRTDMQVALARHSAESSTALSALASDVSKLRADIAAQGIHLSELGSKLSTQRTEKDNLTRAAEDEEHRFAAAKTKEAEVLREVTAERTGWKAEESKLQSQLDSARQKLSKAQKEVAELERLKKEMVERTEALVKRKEHLEGEIENWKTRAAEEKVKMEELLDKAKEGLDAEEARRRAMQESIVELGNQATADRAAVKQLEADWARERAELAKEQNELRQSIAVDEQETVKLRAEVPEWEARKVEVAHLFATLSEERAGVEDQMTNMESKLEEQQRCVALATSERDEIAERVRLKRMKLEEARKGHDLVQNEIRNEKFRAEKSQKELQGKIAAADRELARLANESKRIANERTKLENEARLAEQGTSRVNVQQEMLNRELDAVSAECNSLRDSELPAIVAECTKYRELIANSETELAESERTLAVDEHPRDNNSGHAHALEEIRKARQAICEISAEAEACLGHAASKGWTGLNDLLFVDFNN